jgi:hypothetical protein
MALQEIGIGDRCRALCRWKEQTIAIADESAKMLSRLRADINDAVCCIGLEVLPSVPAFFVASRSLGKQRLDK